MKQWATFLFLLFSCSTISCFAQTTSSAALSQETVVSIARLMPPSYPPVARQTRVTGDVELELTISPDGVVASVTTVKGHPLLVQAALDSARQSQYLCVGCGEEPRQYRLVYTFELGPPIGCEETNSNPKPDDGEPNYPQLKQSKDHITVIERAWVTCDLAGTLGKSKRRSIKCLYLWRCESRLITYE